MPGAYTARIHASSTMCWETEVLHFQMNESSQVVILRFVQKGFQLRVDIPDWMDELHLRLDDPQQPEQQRVVLVSSAHGPCLPAGVHTFAPLGNMQFQHDQFTWSTIDPQPVRLEPMKLLVEGRIQFHATTGDVDVNDLFVVVVDDTEKLVVNHCQVQQPPADKDDNEDATENSLVYSFWMPQGETSYVASVHSFGGQQEVVMLQPQGVVVKGVGDFSELLHQHDSLAAPTIYTVIESRVGDESSLQFTSWLVVYAAVALLGCFRWPQRLFGNGFWHTVVTMNLPLLCLSALGVSPFFMQGYMLGASLFTFGWHLRRRRNLLGVLMLAVSHICLWIVIHIGLTDQLFLLPLCVLTAFGWRLTTVSRYLAI